jgi:iron complex outermembrane receptor protein
MLLRRAPSNNAGVLKRLERLLPLSALMIAAPVVAQDSTQESETALAEVVVSARYRQENLQETPLAITAISGDALQARGLAKVEDIGASVPNAYIRPAHAAYAGAPTIQIRGVGQQDFLFAFEPGVGVYIDDVYHATLFGSSFDLMDIERVEVLRGPQGTLFGKNSLGGAIRVVSSKPSGDTGGRIEATYGKFDRLELKGSYDFPLVEDKLFMRISGVSKQRDGYQDMLDFTCQMIANGTPQLAGIGDGLAADGADADALPDAVAPGSAADNAFSFPQYSAAGKDCKLGERGEERMSAGRVMLRYDGGDRLEALLAADYMNDEQTPPASYLVYPTIPIAPGALSAYNSGAIYRRYGIRTDIDNRFVTGNPYATYGTFGDPFTGRFLPAVVKNEGWGVQGTFDYKLTDNVRAKLTTAWREYDGQSVRDDDETPFPINTVFYVMSHEQFTTELQLTGTLLGDALEWTVGGFYYTADQVQAGEVMLGDLAFLNIVPPFSQNDVFDSKNTSAFAHAVYDLTDRLSLTGGLRYTDESKSYLFDHGTFLRISDPARAALNRVDWKVGADFRFTDQMMAYGQVSTGFRSPGFQPRPFTPIQLLPFDGEELTAYELGLKSDLLDRRMRLNAAAFYSDYSKRFVGGAGARQCSAPTVPSDPVFDPICPAGTFFAGSTGISWPLQVVAPAEMYGVEAELTYRPIEPLTLEATAGYMQFDGKITDRTRQGYRHPDALVQPEWNASAGVEYRLTLGNVGSLVPRLDWFYQSKMTFGPVNRAPLPEETIGAYSVFNGRIEFVPADGDWSAALAVTNLTDEFYYYNFFGSGPTFGGGMKGTPSRPREWAVTFQHRF